MKKALIILNALVLAVMMPLTTLVFMLQYTVLQPEFILDTLHDTDTYMRARVALDNDLIGDLPVEFSFVDVVSADWMEEQVTTITTSAFSLVRTPGAQIQDIEGTLSLAPLKEVPFDQLFEQMQPNVEDFEQNPEAFLEYMPQESRSEYDQRIAAGESSEQIIAEWKNQGFMDETNSAEEEQERTESMLNLQAALPEAVPLNVLVALIATESDAEPALAYYVEHGSFDESILHHDKLQEVNEGLFRVQAGVEMVRVALLVLLLIDLVAITLIGLLSGAWQRAVANIGHALWAPGVSILGVGISLWVASVPLRALLFEQLNVELGALSNVSQLLIQDIVSALLRTLAQPWVLIGSVLLVISITTTVVYKVMRSRRQS